MILFVRVKLNEIFDQGRQFNWDKPHQCPRCDSVRLWGHGFVLAFFDGFAQGLLLRRFRCPDCRCIIRLRPQGYFRRFQAGIHTIRSCLEQRLSGGAWRKDMPSSRQRHWLSRLEAQMHGLFRPRHGFNGRFRSADKKGLHTGQPRHLAATSFRYSKTLPNSALFGF